ncbi:hypothetical protein FRX31_002382, partial [Thalictrum thalictroides]
MGITTIPTNGTGNNEAHTTIADNPDVENPNIQNPDPHHETIHSPLVINEIPASRRRGRPPGATNRIPKPTKKDKGKSQILIHNDAESNKKRKTMETSAPFSSYASDPTITEVPSNTSSTPNPSPFSLDFIRQLMLHPESASLLVNDGIINPTLISLINNQPPSHNSPTSIFNGPYGIVSDEETSDNENMNINDISAIEIGTQSDLLTHDPSGTYENRNGTDLKVDANVETDGINSPTGQLLYSSTGEAHNE